MRICYLHGEMTVKLWPMQGEQFQKGWFGMREDLGKHAGNAPQYGLTSAGKIPGSPLQGKHLCFLGSSVTEGACSMGISFVEYMAERNGFSYVKEAVSGTTLTDIGEESYVSRMKARISRNETFDAFVCQLSTNDASRGLPLGIISAGRNLEEFDVHTITGAMEYIIVYVKQTWSCPVVFYTGTRYDSIPYRQMVDRLLELQKKYGIGVIDLWNNREMNEVSEEEYRLYMHDPVHPVQAGYLKWWTPVMEDCLFRIMGQGASPV